MTDRRSKKYKNGVVVSQNHHRILLGSADGVKLPRERERKKKEGKLKKNDQNCHKNIKIPMRVLGLWAWLLFPVKILLFGKMAFHA